MALGTTPTKHSGTYRMRRWYVAGALAFGIFLLCSCLFIRTRWAWDSFLYAPKDGRVFGVGTRVDLGSVYSQDPPRRPSFFVSYIEPWHHAATRQYHANPRVPGFDENCVRVSCLTTHRPVAAWDELTKLSPSRRDQLEWDHLGAHYYSACGYGTIIHYLPRTGAGYSNYMDQSSEIVRLRILYVSLNLLVPVAMVAVLIPALVIWRCRRRYRYRRKNCLCLSCGYDLRGSTGRCPECGLVLFDEQGVRLDAHSSTGGTRLGCLRS